MKKNGNNFNENPLTFEEFIDVNDKQFPIYNNFFYNFYVYPVIRNDQNVMEYGRNYKRLQTVDKELADELSDVYEKFALALDYMDKSILKNNLKGLNLIEGHMYPKEILQKGYHAYLLLRVNFSKDEELLKRIFNYYDGYPEAHPKYDDWAAFFS